MIKSLEKIQMNPDPIYITVFVNLLITESATQTELFEKINQLLEISLPRETIKSLLAAVSTKKNGEFSEPIQRTLSRPTRPNYRDGPYIVAIIFMRGDQI